MRPFCALSRFALCALVLLSSFAPAARAVPPQQGEEAQAYQPPIANTTEQERLSTLNQMKIPAGMQKELVAGEPLFANPVAFCFDNTGRIFVAETFRQGKGVEDNRSHMYWLSDDLAAQTVEDRAAYMRKHAGKKGIGEYTEHADQVRLLVDRDGDGKMDQGTVFAGGFNDLLDGTGASVLFYKDALYYTCIPNLWRFQDTNGDGEAEKREVLHRGYGVRFAFRGHDLHGLTVGPDGKIYFSIGDRGYNVTTPEGTIADPEAGAVFRCNADGSELEVFARGLRNPQELAFDQYGNLFTGDNNSDSGDKARFVHVVEDGDSGWRMAYQYLPDRGPWNREKLWHPYHEHQPAYIVPPIANLANGPSGLAYYPGTGMPERYHNHFFLCEFRGGSANSGVLSFELEPDGAFFELGPVEQTLWSVLATDVDFGPDNGLYVLDWVNGWHGVGKGRIYRVTDPELAQKPVVAETKALLAEGMKQRDAQELLDLLAHANMRVRLAAQFELADRGAQSIPALEQVALKADAQLARIHALWGLGQIARSQPKALASLPNLLKDSDAEIRAQAAKLLGDHGQKQSATALISLLADSSSRVRFFAAQSLGKLGVPEALAPLAEMLRANADRDPVLRHGGVMGLVGTGDVRGLVELGQDESPAVRTAAVVALRRLAAPEVAQFLNDSNGHVVDEAARAIHDLPITAALPELAAMIGNTEISSDALLRRVLNANFRLGGAENARALAEFAARTSVPAPLRVEAIAMLADWRQPSPNDRVLNLWRPLAERDVHVAADALRSVLPQLMAAGPNVRSEAIKTAAKYRIGEIGSALVLLAKDRSLPASQRVEAFEALAVLDDPQLEAVVRHSLNDPSPEMRAAVRNALASLRPAEAIEPLQRAVESGTVLEQQSALATLTTIADPRANEVLAAWIDRLRAGSVPAEIQLDLLEAAQKRKGKTKQLRESLAAYEASQGQDDPAAEYQVALAGGDAERGRQIFFHRVQVSCVRCHTVGDEGGEVGPSLTKIGAEKDRQYLLDAIVLPNKAIAKGFATVMVILDSGRVVSGIIKDETDETLRLINADGDFTVVAKDEIDEMVEGQSAMPADVVKQLTKRDLRDLVEFLAQQK